MESQWAVVGVGERSSGIAAGQRASSVAGKFGVAERPLTGCQNLQGVGCGISVNVSGVPVLHKLPL